MTLRIPVLVLLLAVPSVAAAGSAVQLSPDGKRALVNKDLAGERWAITCEDGNGSPIPVWSSVVLT